jgi:hypothetical protein
VAAYLRLLFGAVFAAGLGLRRSAGGSGSVLTAISVSCVVLRRPPSRHEQCGTATGGVTKDTYLLRQVKRYLAAATGIVTSSGGGHDMSNLTKRALRWLAPVTVVAAIGLVGCGGGDQETTRTAAPKSAISDSDSPPTYCRWTSRFGVHLEMEAAEIARCRRSESPPRAIGD